MAIVHLGAKRLQGIKSDRVSDSLGSSAGGTNSGVTLDTSNKKLGTACYSFDGTDDYVVLTDVGTNGIDTTGDLSIVCWINLNVTNANQAIISNDSNSSSAGINLYVHSSNQLRFGGGSAGTQVTGATSKFTASTWYHVAVVKSGANCSLYVDGVQDGSTQTDWGTIDGQAQATIGAQYSGSAYGDDFNGKIDDLAIYKRALTTTEITALYNSGTGALVSSLSTAGLKAYYTMDSTALTSLKGTADWTEDFSETTPTAWAEDSSSGYENNLEPYKSSSNGLWFDLDRHASIGVTGTFDLQNAGLLGANPSNTLWTFRFKINFTNLTTAVGSMFIGLTDSSSAGANGACRFVGVRFKIGDGIRNISDNGGQALTVSNRTDGGLASTITTGTDYYVTVSRHNANTLVTTVRSGSHTGTLVGEVTADTLETATDDLRYWKIQNHRASANGGQLRGYVYDLEFFNDSATTTGCKNDASSTSELDGMTNLPANTIFEQTDDTPTYWWKQSDNTWKIDGSVTTSVSTASSTGWTLQAGSSGDINVNSTSSGKLYYDLDAVNGTSQIMTYDLGSALSDEKWVMRLVVNNSTWGTLSQGYVTLSSTITGSDATGDNIGFASLYGGSGNKRLRFLSAITDQKLKDTLDSDTYDDSNTTTGTDYFIEIARTSSTAATMKIRTGSHSGTLLDTLTLSQGGNDLSTNTDLRYLKVFNLNTSGWGGNVKGTIHGIEIQNGTTEWLE